MKKYSCWCFRTPEKKHLGCIKPCNQWDKLVTFIVWHNLYQLKLAGPAKVGCKCDITQGYWAIHETSSEGLLFSNTEQLRSSNFFSSIYIYNNHILSFQMPLLGLDVWLYTPLRRKTSVKSKVHWNNANRSQQTPPLECKNPPKTVLHKALGW